MNLSVLKQVFPRANDSWLIELVGAAPSYGIDTPAELSAFLAQTGHETRGFTQFEENLSYSAARLMQVWPKRFPDLHVALQYAHNPQSLAEKVYGGRMGNAHVGDGYKYRGRGAIMLTGANSYRRAQELTGIPLLANPDQVLVPRIGAKAACAWWQASGADDVDDDDDARDESNIVNGGDIGLRERQALLDELRKVIV